MTFFPDEQDSKEELNFFFSTKIEKEHTTERERERKKEREREKEERGSLSYGMTFHFLHE